MPAEHAEYAAGDMLGPYRLRSLLAEGGMGRVFDAVGPHGEEVAVKVLRSEIARDPLVRRRFDREARTARRIDHPHVVPVLDVGEQDGMPYMAQLFVRGGSLADKLEREGPLSLGCVLALCLEVASGLDAIHAAGLVHRDLKPANILLDDQGGAHIADFGLAKDTQGSALTRPGQAVGSVDYMAPEQIRAERVTPATDVYGLGCVIFACLQGTPPFSHREGMRILWAQLQERPPDPCEGREELPAALGPAVLQALEKKPANRPQTPMLYARSLVAAARGSAGVEHFGAY